MQPMGARYVVGPEIGRQAVFDIICQSQRLIVAIEGDRSQKWPEDFLLSNAHAVTRIREQRGGKVVALRAPGGPTAARRQGRPVFLADAHVAHHLVEMTWMDQRADFRVRVEWIADLDPLDPLGQSRGELIIDPALDEQAAAGGAALAVQAVDHKNDCVERAIEVGIGEQDHGILPAELKMDAFQRRRALRHNQAASC